MDCMDITRSVQDLYERFPFPPDPVTQTPPPGWNWRWSWSFAHSFCLGTRPRREDVRILDAGCGTGVGTEYLAYQNPHAAITAIDLSAASLAVARQRCEKFANVEFAQMTLLDAGQLEGSFDFINCVGVLHHLADPVAGMRALTDKLAPGGLMHLFVYGELGRWEIRLMQEAIRLLRAESGSLEDGLRIGRELFNALPESNRLVQAERERWVLENRDDACFVDMYVQVQEICYTIPTLFELIDHSGLTFIGFSNPNFWSTERLLDRAPWLVEQANSLDMRARLRLIELLDPSVSHYEFFLGRPPLAVTQWTDALLLSALAQRSPYLKPWPAQQLFDHEYEVVNLSETEVAFLDSCDGRRSIGALLANHPLAGGLADVRKMLRHFMLQLDLDLQAPPEAH